MKNVLMSKHSKTELCVIVLLCYKNRFILTGREKEFIYIAYIFLNSHPKQKKRTENSNKTGSSS